MYRKATRQPTIVTALQGIVSALNKAVEIVTEDAMKQLEEVKKFSEVKKQNGKTGSDRA